MTILWSFFYNSFVKLHCKNVWNHITVLYPNPCYNEMCYKGTTLYFVYLLKGPAPKISVFIVMSSSKGSGESCICADSPELPLLAYTSMDVGKDSDKIF